MKRREILLGLVVAILVGGMAGCGKRQAMALVNTLVFESAGIQRVRLDYDADDITVLEGEGGSIVLKEYQSQDKAEYYARTSKGNGELVITEGRRPRRADFSSYVELYLPADYRGGLRLHTTSGAIRSALPLELSEEFRADTTSGRIGLSNLRAADIHIATTSGAVEGEALTAAGTFQVTSTSGPSSFDQLAADVLAITTINADTAIRQATGKVSYQSKGGTLSLSGLSGSGLFHASGDGDMEVGFLDLTGDVRLYSKNGTLDLTLPSRAAFRFSAATKEGTVETAFPQLLTGTDRAVTGVVGDAPQISVELETRNGHIRVTR